MPLYSQAGKLCISLEELIVVCRRISEYVQDPMPVPLKSDPAFQVLQAGGQEIRYLGYCVPRRHLIGRFVDLP